MADLALGPTIPGITAEASYEKNLPAVDRALKAGDEAPTPEERGRKKALALYDLAKNWYDAHAWYYRECVESRAMVNGAQYGYYSTWESRWIPVPEVRNPYEIRLVVNLEKPIVDQATAILTQESPQFECAPGATEVRDAAAAEAASELTRYIWDQHFLDSKFRETGRSAFICGTAFIRCLWDTTAGGPALAGFGGGDIQTDPTGMPLPPTPLTPNFAPQGDHLFDVLQRDQVAFDPAARSIDGSDGVGIMVKEKIPTTKVMEIWPSYRPQGSDKSGTEGEAMREDRVERYTPYQPSWGVKQGTNDPAADETIVFTFYMRSRSGFPLGKVYQFTSDGQLLDERDNEVYPTWEEQQAGELWPNYHWPVFAIYCDTRENSPWGRGRVLDMHHAQKSANGVFSKAVQHAAIIANSKVYLPKGLDVEWTDEMGQVIRYGRQHQPNAIGYVQPPMMPAEYMTIFNVAREAMENIAGINAATMGAAPSADPSGRLSESLQSRDYVRLEFIKNEMYRKWALVMKWALRQFRRYAATQRRLLVTGENGETAMKFFDRSSLASGTDVVVFNNQAIPRDPSKRMLWLMNFSTMLAQTADEKTRILLLKLMDKRDFVSFLEEQDPHRIRAERMIRQAMLGLYGQPQPWDNPLVFKVVFEEYITKEEFERAAGENPELAAWATQMWTYYTTAAAPQPPAMPQMQSPGEEAGEVPAAASGSQDALAMSGPAASPSPAGAGAA